MNRVGAVKQHITGLTIAAALIVVAGITSWLSGASESAAQVVGIGAVILSGLALLIWGIDPIFKLPDDSFGQPKE